MESAVAIRSTSVPLGRRTFLALVSGGLLAAPLGAEAQPSTTIPRIGLLADATSWEPLRLGLRDLGYVEGKSIALEERSFRGETSDSRISRPSSFGST